MKPVFVPNYYTNFSCIASACRHSCCIGWEIDVDGEALSRYASVTGELGDRLRRSIDYDSDPPCFILTEDERCPFLNQNGLCDLICELGEDSLCQICSDHPRFYNRLPDRVEAGLGLCCEAVAELILSQTEPFSVVRLPEDAREVRSLNGCGEALDRDPFVERALEMREGLLAILCDRRLPLGDRIRHALGCFDIDLTEEPPLLRDYGELEHLLRNMERLDPAWDRYLDALKGLSESPLAELDGEEGIPFEQLLCYFLYRYFAVEADGREGILEIRLLLAILSVSIIHAIHRALGGDPATLLEISRMYSSEVEYSEENMETLMDAIEEILF